MTVVDAPDPVTVGGQLSYTVTVTNNGPSNVTDATVPESQARSAARG